MSPTILIALAAAIYFATKDDKPKTPTQPQYGQSAGTAPAGSDAATTIGVAAVNAALQVGLAYLQSIRTSPSTQTTG